MSEIVDFFFSSYPSAQERRSHAAIEDGLAHGSRIEPHDPLPGEPITLLFSTKLPTPIDCVAVYYTTDGTEPQGAKGETAHGQVVFAQRSGQSEHLASSKGVPLQQWQAVLPPQPDGTLVRYRADGWSLSDLQAHWNADRVDPVSTPVKEGRVFAYSVDRWRPPQWWQDAIVYQIFVDRFSAGSDEPPLLTHDETEITNFYSGTLKGILEKLDYIQELGANCLWLSPIFESPTHHGYNASDYYTVARRYGTNDTLRHLISECHRRGMRIMFDFVANHTSDEHSAFVAALHDPESVTADWYAFDDESHRYRSYARVSNMPELLTDNPKVQRYLFDAALAWLRDFGADALRLDYMPGPSLAFWALFQREIKTHFPQALTLGEITAPLPEIADYAGRVDAFMDFPLTQVLRNVFARRTTPLSTLLSFLDERRFHLPTSMGRATLLDNHDMHRFLWLADNDKARLRLAATCHMTLDGTPIIYYGTEVGLSQYNDAYKENAYARAPMLWHQQQDKALLEHYHHLLALRHKYEALRWGGLATVPVQLLSAQHERTTTRLEQEQATQQVGSYLRYTEQQKLLVILNNNEETVRLRISFDTAQIIAGAHLQNVLELGRTEITVHDNVLEVMLPALGATIVEILS